MSTPGESRTRAGACPRHPKDRGFSLIEVIVALAMLAAVLLAISGLFAQGANSIKGGKEMTEALAQATDILEDINQLSYRQVYTVFGGSGTDTSLQADTRVTSNFANRWEAQLEEAVWQGYALIDVVPVGIDTVLPLCASSPPAQPNFQCGQGLRVVVTVHWDERGNDQQLSLSTVRF
jgi:prepilin-type N-terminal cleavage/methylation domain-containing protein